MGTLRALTSRVALSLVTLVSAEARAEDTGTVSVRGVCMPPGTSGPEVLRILQAELAPSRVRMVDDSPTPRGDHDVVLSIADCSETPSGARVAVWQHGDESELSVTLTDTSPAARSRTFALALAESVRDVLVVPRDPGFTLTPIETPPKQHATPTPGTTPRDAQHVGSGEERTRDAVGGLLFRGAAEFRFVPKTSTPLVGADLGVAGRRFAVGLSVLGTERSTPIGSVDLLALAALASADVVDLTPVFKVRASAELGVATASGSPSGTATGHTVASPHAALDAGLAALLPLDARWLLEAYASAGYAASLSADADGRDAAALNGVFVTFDLGLRLPVQL
jgi:hypothetical protein